MSLSPGKRLKTVRELMGLNRNQFSKLTGVDYLRMVTIEEDRGRMGVDDVALIVAHFPELLKWLVLGTELDLVACSNSGNAYLTALVDNIETHGWPEIKS